MTVSTPVPKDHPLMIEWDAYKATEEYANTKRWAGHAEHVEGSLWAAFVHGWEGRAAWAAPPAVTSPPRSEATRDSAINPGAASSGRAPEASAVAAARRSGQDALDGQAPLDEANNEVVRVRAARDSWKVHAQAVQGNLEMHAHEITSLRAALGAAEEALRMAKIVLELCDCKKVTYTANIGAPAVNVYQAICAALSASPQP